MLHQQNKSWRLPYLFLAAFIIRFGEEIHKICANSERNSHWKHAEQSLQVYGSQDRLWCVVNLPLSVIKDMPKLIKY